MKELGKQGMETVVIADRGGGNLMEGAYQPLDYP